MRRQNVITLALSFGDIGFNVFRCSHRVSRHTFGVDIPTGQRSHGKCPELTLPPHFALPKKGHERNLPISANYTIGINPGIYVMI